MESHVVANVLSLVRTDDGNVTLTLPTLPAGQQDEHFSVPVVIGK